MHHSLQQEIAHRRVAASANSVALSMSSKSSGPGDRARYRFESDNIQKGDVATDEAEENMLAMTHRAMKQRMLGMCFSMNMLRIKFSVRGVV